MLYAFIYVMCNKIELWTKSFVGQKWLTFLEVTKFCPTKNKSGIFLSDKVVISQTSFRDNNLI